jgi:hypothetical protein
MGDGRVELSGIEDSCRAGCGEVGERWLSERASKVVSKRFSRLPPIGPLTKSDT